MDYSEKSSFADNTHWLDLPERVNELFNFVANNEFENVKEKLKSVDNKRIKDLIHEKYQMGLAHWASLKGCFIIQNWMIDSINMQPDYDNNPWLWTCAHLAVIGGHEKCLESLLYRQSDLMNRPDRRGCTPIHLAAVHGRSHCLSLMLNNGTCVPRVDLCSKLGWTALLYASWHGRISIVEQLMRYGVATDITDMTTGRSPLHMAASEGHAELVRYFVDEGYRVKPGVSVIDRINAQDNDGRSAIDLAVLYHKTNIVKLLRDKLNDPRAWDTNEDIAFPGHIAALRGDYRTVARLLSHGNVSVNDVDDRGYSMLHKVSVNKIEAGVYSSSKVIEILKSRGASVHLTTYAGENAQDIAEREGHLELVKLLDTNSESFRTFDKRTQKYIDIGESNEKHKKTSDDVNKSEDEDGYDKYAITIPLFHSLDHADSILDALSQLSHSSWSQKMSQMVSEKVEEIEELQKKVEYTEKVVNKLSSGEIDEDLIGNDIKDGLATEETVVLLIAQYTRECIYLRHLLDLAKFNLRQLVCLRSEREIKTEQLLASTQHQLVELNDQLAYEKLQRESIEAENQANKSKLTKVCEYVVNNQELLPLELIDLAVPIYCTDNVLRRIGDEPECLSTMINQIKCSLIFTVKYPIDDNSNVILSKLNCTPQCPPNVKCDKLSSVPMSCIEFHNFIKKLLINPNKKLTKQKKVRRHSSCRRRKYKSPTGGVFITTK